MAFGILVFSVYWFYFFLKSKSAKKPFFDQIIFKTPNINWYKNGTKITNDDSIEIDETYLRFKSLDYKINSGNYSCQFILINKKMITSSLFEVKIERKYYY